MYHQKKERGVYTALYHWQYVHLEGIIDVTAQFFLARNGENTVFGLNAMAFVESVAVTGSAVKKHGKSASLNNELVLTVIAHPG